MAGLYTDKPGEQRQEFTTPCHSPSISSPAFSGGTRRLEAERIFLNVGTHSANPDVPGLTPVEALWRAIALPKC
jgi:hypothetical protein